MLPVAAAAVPIPMLPAASVSVSIITASVSIIPGAVAVPIPVAVVVVAALILQALQERGAAVVQINELLLMRQDALPGDPCDMMMLPEAGPGKF